MPRIIDWFQLPVNASEHAVQVDAMNEFVHRFMFVLLIGWSCFLVYVLIRFWHRRNRSADYHGVRSHASTHLEVGVVIVEAVLLLGFAFPLWAQRVEEWPTGEIEEIRAVGYQFGWAFHYPGPDGMFGRVDRELFSANAVGVDREDPNGKDDIISAATLVLPKDRSVVIDVTSRDVIHSLALTQLRISQDAIPGVDYPMWFIPRRKSPPPGGEEKPWEIICAQLCGEGHSGMIGYVEVLEPEDFDQWVKSTAPKPEAAADPAPDDPTATE